MKDPDKRLRVAKEIVRDWYNNNVVPRCGVTTNAIALEDIYIVWFCKTLQNWKALLSTDIPDTRYYEITFNGDAEQAYLDVYLKEKNETIIL